MRTVVISQPMLFPWVGLFEQVRLADVFVHYDDVAFSKGSFVNRVQIKTACGSQWMTIPLQRHQFGKTIVKLAASGAADWKRTHLERLEQAYRDAAYVGDMLAVVKNVYSTCNGCLVDLLIESVEASWRYFDFKSGPAFQRSSALSIPGQSSERVLNIVKRFGATRYVTGHGARNYLDHAAFEGNNVHVQYLDYQRKPYRQLHGEFDPYVSILDLIANHGRAGRRFICSPAIGWRKFVHAHQHPPAAAAIVTKAAS